MVEHAGAASLQLSIPQELLAALGISFASAMSSHAIKSFKDTNHFKSIGIAKSGHPSLAQMFLAEQGLAATRTIDLTKFQNF